MAKIILPATPVCIRLFAAQDPGTVLPFSSGRVQLFRAERNGAALQHCRVAGGQAHLHRDHGQDRCVQRHHQPGQPGAERGRQRVTRALLEAEKSCRRSKKLIQKPRAAAVCGFFINREGRSPHASGASIVFPHAAQMCRLHQKSGRFDFHEQKLLYFLPRAPRNVKPCWWSICCAAPRWR